MSTKPNIWQLQAQSDIEGLTTALESDDPGIRKRAAAALRTLGATSAVPTLKGIIDKESDPDTRAHVLAALEQLTNEQTVDEDTQDASKPMLEQNRISRLVAELGHSDPKRVIAATRELALQDDRLAAEPLVMLFNDSGKPNNVRLAAAEALLRLESAPVEASLLGALRSPKWEIRRKAAGVLGQIKAEWAILPLHRSIVNDKHEAVRRTARAALKHIGTPQALAALKAALQAAPPETPATNEKQKPAQPGPTKKNPPTEKPQQRSALLARMEGTISSQKPAEDPASQPEAENTPDAEPSKLSWPKRNMTQDVFLAPTAQLDPSILDEFARRLQQHSPVEELGHQAQSDANEAAADAQKTETQAEATEAEVEIEEKVEDLTPEDASEAVDEKDAPDETP